MMVGGGAVGFSGVGRVVYTWGSVVKRWILSVHIGVARPRRHWTRVSDARGAENTLFPRKFLEIHFPAEYLISSRISRNIGSITEVNEGKQKISLELA